jgi:hypothetical protein
MLWISRHVTHNQNALYIVFINKPQFFKQLNYSHKLNLSSYPQDLIINIIYLLNNITIIS